MSIVYIVQKPVKILRDGNGAIVKYQTMFDTRTAQRYGDTQILCEPGDISSYPDKAIALLQKQLAVYNDNDYILPTGDPVLSAAAVTIAANVNNGRVKILKWDKFDKAYTILQYDFSPKEHNYD